jgi:hypothetical protein
VVIGQAAPGKINKYAACTITSCYVNIALLVLLSAGECLLIKALQLCKEGDYTRTTTLPKRLIIAMWLILNLEDLFSIRLKLQLRFLGE